MNTPSNTTHKLFAGFLFLCLFATSIIVPLYENENSLMKGSIPHESGEKTIQPSTGINMANAEKGNPAGPVNLFIHGFPDAWHSFGSLLRLMPES